jgi:NAD(P)-dependent dehydrogenase (short-subunit alcohol dehydrogenase family)
MTTKKRVLVTGANSGIGYFLTLSLLEKSFRVAVLDIVINEISRWQEKYTEDLLIIQCDLTCEKEVKEAVAVVLKSWDQIDIVVNNACKAIFKHFEQTDINEIQGVFEVNVMGLLHVIKAVLPGMLERNEGIIHNVSSGVGITGFKNLLGYSTSKGAVETLTRCLALEYSETHIIFNVIHPPLTATPSARPIGLPREWLEDPEKVGRLLSQKIGSRKRVITTDWRSAMGIRFMKLFPYFMGKMLLRLTSKNQTEKTP